MERPNPSSLPAAVLLPLLVLASCGGDDSPTAPGGGRLDSRLFGTWESQSMGFTYTFKDDGSGTLDLGGEVFDVVWWTEDGQLTVTVASVLRYAISDGVLTFQAVGDGGVYPTILPEYAFRADGNPDGLTGVTWVDEDGDELVFRSDGTYSWGDGFESGSWIAEGRTLRVYDEDEDEGSDYEVRGNTLTWLEERFTKR